MSVDMNVIDKRNGTLVRELSIDECGMLSPDRRGEKRAQQLLQELHSLGRHLECNCTSPPALMFAKHYTKNGDHFGLVCHAIKGAHDIECPNYRTISGEILSHNDAVARSASLSQDNFQSLSLLSPFATGTKSGSGISSPIETKDKGLQKHSTKKLPALVALALYLIKTSGLNIVDSRRYYDASEHSSIASLIAAADDIAFGEESGKGKLSDWIFYGAKGHRWACSRLYKAEEEGNWKKGSRPHAFVIRVAHKITMQNDPGETKHFSLDEEPPIYVQRIITEGAGVKASHSSGEDGKGTEGPFLVMYSVARPTQSRKFQGHTVYIKPILTESCFLPIDSNYERNFAKRAIYHLLKSDKGGPVKFVKPLDGVVHNDRYLLPDFLLEVGREKHLIEIMGMLNNPEYVSRKAHIIPLMQDVWPSHTIYELDPRVDDRLSVGNVSHYIESVLKPLT